jgi:glyoxylase-like metal-dependent hydrolase (beta-lactamase superfamily II)
MKRPSLTIAILSVGAAVSLAAREPSSVGSLIPAPIMSAGRIAHSATALPDGRVLVAGGFLEEGSTQGAEIFDSDAGRFSPLPAMLRTRHSHTATLLPDGKVLIAGGYGEGTTTLAAAEIFDPKANSFAPTGSLLAARAGHTAALLDNGKVLIAGGVGPEWHFLSSAELYDPATGKFLPTGSMSVARESHVAVRLLDGRVLIVGGHRDRREEIKLHASAETYDPNSGVFNRVGDMRVRRHKHDAVLLSDGRVLITGGSDERDSRGVYDSSEFFDPETAAFTAGPQMKLGRYKHAGSSLLLPNGLVLIAGGAPQAEIYDPRSNSFVLVGGEARIAGQFAAVAPVKGGVLITGGYGNPAVAQSAAWLYRP